MTEEEKLGVSSCESEVCSPDQRFENVPDDSDEVCRMNDVQRLQVLLVSETTCSRFKHHIYKKNVTISS